MRQLILMYVATCFLFGSPLQSEQTPRLEVRGFVLEVDTNQPVEGAEVRILSQAPGPVLINGGWKLDELIKTTTDATGTFSLSPSEAGTYRIQTKKEGFGTDASGAGAFAEVKVTKEQPLAETKLFLARLGALSGIVVDENTRQPLPNLQLRAVRALPKDPRFVPGGGVSFRSGADGQFVVGGLQPGDYAVQVQPRWDASKRVLTTFTEKDLDEIDLDYEGTYWPGGGDAEAILPVTVRSGAPGYIGMIMARKVPYYRVHVHFAEFNCEPGETVQVSESTVDVRYGGTLFGPPIASTQCGKDFLITGYPSGIYRLLLTVRGTTPRDRGTASIPFAVANKNIAIVAAILPPVAVDGTFVLADGAKPTDFTKLSVFLRPVDWLASTDEEQPAPDREGKFRAPDLRAVNRIISVSGLGVTHYVKEIRYNGIRLRDETVPLEEPATARSLTIVIDDKVAAVTGRVATFDGPVKRPIVIAVRWPWNSFDLVRAAGDDTGRFKITGLTPGEYRIIALESIQQMANTRMAVVERILSAGKKVELSPGAIQNITLEPSNLTKAQY